MKHMNVFAGYSISRQKSNRGYFTLTFQSEMNHIVQFPPEEILLEKEKSISIHCILLCALIDALRKLSDSKLPSNPLFVTYYCDNRKIAFEWNEEYLKDHKFSSYYSDGKLWEEIAKICSEQQIELRIAKTDSVLNGIVRSESERADNL